MGGNTSGAVKQVENISNAYQNAAKEAEKLADAQSKIGQKTNISLGNKIDEAVTSAKDLDKTLNQVNIPTDSFDKVLEKLDRTKSELVDIVKITKQSVSDADGKFHDSYTLKDSRGSTEIYGVNSKTDKGQILRQNIVDYDAKKDAIDNSKELLALEKELQKETEASNNANRKKFQDFQKEQANYEESINKVNSAIQKTDKILDTLPLHDKLDSQFLDMIDSVDNLNSKLKSGELTLSEYKNEVKSLTSEYSKMIDIQQKRDVEEYNVAANTRKTKTNQFKKIDDKFSKYSKQYTSLENSPAGYQHNDKYKAELEEYNNQLKAIKVKIQAIKDQDIDVVDQKDLSELDEMYAKLDKINNSLSHTPATQKGSTKESRQKVFNMINELKQFTGMARESKLELEAMEQRFKNLGTNLNVSEAISEVKAFKAQLVATNQTTKNLLDTVKDKAWYGWAAQLAGMFSFYDVINSAQKAIDTVIKLDDALVDLKKTTAMNSTQLEQYYYDANDVAKQMGVTTEEIINQSSAWSRLGYNTAEASTEMAKLSSQFASISPGMEVDEAQSGLVSIMKAWSIDPDQVKSEIMDPINQLGNTMAEDNQDIVEGMERSAAALAAVGTSTKDAFALFSGIQEVLQNAEKSGTSLRSVALRLRSFDETTEEYSSDLANITGELVDLTKTAEHVEGVSIFKPGSTTEFKDLTDYFREIASIWDEMTQKQQNDFLIKAFGRNQAQAGAALIQNFKAVDKALNEMDQSADSSDKEMDAVKQSLTYKLNALKETWTGTVQDIVNRGDLGKVIDGLTTISEGVGNLISNLGLVKTAALGVSAALSFKNVGRVKIVALM